MFVLWLVTISAGIILFLHLRYQASVRYWRNKGVKGPDIRTNIKIFLQGKFLTKQLGLMLNELYNAHPAEKLVGYHDLFKYNLLVRDPHLLEQILVKDFPCYSHHGIVTSEEDSPMDVSLFTMAGNKWRALRNKLTPTFTTGKLRGMTAYMVDCCRNTEEYLRPMGESIEVDVKDLSGMFATDVVGCCVFGMDAKALGKPGSEFRKMGARMFKMTLKRLINIMIIMQAPALAKKLKLGFNEPEVESYFVKLALDTIEMRRRDNIKRNDFLQLLMQLRDKGSIELHTKDLDAEDEYLKTEDTYTTEVFEMSDKLMVSQALSFLTAGFEGISLAMTFFCLEMALNPQIQETLRKEIEEKLSAHGLMTYQAIKEMTYLDQCLNETLRMYPVAPALFREVTKPTTLDGVELEVGTKVFIPTLGLHYDPAYYPDPHKFDPARFHPDVSRQPFTYLPFGEGPRVCIGMRFAILEMKVGLANLVKNFNLGMTSKVNLPLQYEAGSFMLNPKDNVVLHLTKLSRS